MSYYNIWRAIKSENMMHVSKLIRKSRQSNWNAFYHAIMSNNLECVKLVRKYFHPRTNCVSCDDGLTYLAIACKHSLSLNIVKYLLRLDKRMVHQVDYRNRTPLYYAVASDRFDIVELLLVCGAVVNVTIQSDGPIQSDGVQFATIEGGCVEMLIHLLFTMKLKWPFHSPRYGLTPLEVFAEDAMYHVRNKVACFQILFNYEHPEHMYRQRYYVNDILEMALLSHSSTSLIPYFIETELKSEKRERIRSLYERLANDYQLLALVVLCECGIVSTERKSLPRSFITYFGVLTADLQRMIKIAVKGRKKRAAANALKLLEDFLEFTSSVEAMEATIFNIIETLLLFSWSLDVKLGSPQYDRYQNVVDIFVSKLHFDIDAVLARVMSNEIEQAKPNMLYAYLKHCSFLFMEAGTLSEHEIEDLLKIPLYRKLLQHFGTWNAVQYGLDNATFNDFSLKRLARDDIRMTIWECIGKSSQDAAARLNYSLQSLPIPEQLKLYLRYSDHTSMAYLINIMSQPLHWLKYPRDHDTDSSSDFDFI